MMLDGDDVLALHTGPVCFGCTRNSDSSSHGTRLWTAFNSAFSLLPFVAVAKVGHASNGSLCGVVINVFPLAVCATVLESQVVQNTRPLSPTVSSEGDPESQAAGFPS